MIPLDDIQPEVWLLSCENVDAETLASWLALLSEHERTNAEARIRQEDKISYLAAHALLRSVLSKRTGLAPQKLRFKAANQYGKPALCPESQIRFNLSHCDGLAALVLAKNLEVGVDTENMSALGLADPFITASFHPAEKDLLSRVSAARKKYTTARIWTAKEAYVKALGIGLAMSFSAFCVHFSPLAIKASETMESVQASLWAYDFLDSHVVSLCVLGMPQLPLAPHLHLVNPSDFLPLCRTSVPS